MPLDSLSLSLSEFVVHLGISRLGETFFTMASGFMGSNEQLCARTETVDVCVDTATGRPMTLPEVLRDALHAYGVERSD